MKIDAKVICDSVSPLGVRISSLELCFPRFILPQILTHRMWSRSTESSRARPVKSKLAEVEQSPYIPTFRRNQKGMVAGEEVDEAEAQYAKAAWLRARDAAVAEAKRLNCLEVAKETVNRLLEPFAFVRMLVTATDFANFFRLRIADDAQPEIQELAARMKEVLAQSNPVSIAEVGWHLPFVSDEDKWNEGYYDADFGWQEGLDKLKEISAARCARISYTTHEGKKSIEKDLELAKTLRESGHSNPFEHVVTPAPDNRRYANFKGWVSYRYRLEQSGRLPNPEG